MKRCSLALVAVIAAATLTGTGCVSTRNPLATPRVCELLTAYLPTFAGQGDNTPADDADEETLNAFRERGERLIRAVPDEIHEATIIVVEGRNAQLGGDKIDDARLDRAAVAAGSVRLWYTSNCVTGDQP